VVWLLITLGLGGAVGLTAWLRARARRPLAEAAGGRVISDLSAGRFRVTGRVVPIRTTQSAIDGAPCVYIEHACYRTVGHDLLPVMREVDHGVVAHPFFLDDGTGRLLLDPAQAIVEAVTLSEDDGLTAELRLRAGEEIQLLATFVRRPLDADAGPYRGLEGWVPIEDDAGPPLLSYRTEPGMVRPTDDVGAFLTGVAFIVLTVCAFFAVLGLQL
jgi:hypothetical protein